MGTDCSEKMKVDWSFDACLQEPKTTSSQLVLRELIVVRGKYLGGDCGEKDLGIEKEHKLRMHMFESLT